ncbi:hypothetical protein AB4876_03535 [Zhongshania guokunii]|uniref:GLTT repeat-containing protein n=1 Tax=Zhongshania guokunii TaxID=641783 RepID=A0ABV3U2C7_9GAMM
MKRKNAKKLAVAALLTSLSSSIIAEPLAPVLSLLGGVGGGGLPGLDSLPLDPSALLGGGANLLSIGDLPVTPADLLSLTELIPLQAVTDAIANTGLPLDSAIAMVGGVADYNSLPINPFSLLAGGGLGGVPATPALLLGGGLPGLELIPVAPLAPILGAGLPSINALPLDLLAIIPI